MKTVLILSYLGTGYHGWQRQENAPTIQQALEDAIEETYGHHIYLSGCGRTDAGVHGAYYVASADLPLNIPADKIPLALNSKLRGDIAVERAVLQEDGFDARFSCKSKEYTYIIHNGRVRDPFLGDRAWFFPQALDIAAMDAGAKNIEGRQDFSCFMTAGSPVKSAVRTVFYCNAAKTGDIIKIKVAADGFLYNMVRTIVGTLVYCGLGKLAPTDIPAIILGQKRGNSGPTAPPQGLYLTALTYGMEGLDGRREV